jgi:polysaccharide pyruvyl transferase WcaK-like protein
MKWIIARLDWVCSARLHCAIAALSSAVPAAAIAYSDKAIGVFETCGQREAVADPRVLTTEELVERLWQLWCGRMAAQRAIAQRLPEVAARCREQIACIAALAGAVHEH